MLPVLFVEYN